MSNALPGWFSSHAPATHYYHKAGATSVQALCGHIALRKSLKEPGTVLCTGCRRQQKNDRRV